MPYSIDDFQGAVAADRGFARSNLFRVILPPIANVSSESLNLLCKNVSMPGKQITTTQSQIGLIQRNVANGFAVDTVNMTFRVMNNPKILEYFSAWRNTIVNENYEVGYYRDYVKQIQIDLLQKGEGFPIFKKQLNLPLPANIRRRLPSLGPLNFAQDELDLNYLTDDKLVWSCKLIDAYPTTFSAIELSDDNADGIIEYTIAFTYKDWKIKGAKSGEEGLIEGLVGDFFRGIFT